MATNETVTVEADGERFMFTTDKNKARSDVAGYSVQCDEYLSEPYREEGYAQARIDFIEDYDACPLPHRIVPVYRTSSGPRRAMAVDSDEPPESSAVVV